MTDIVFMDTETLGLDIDAPIWEFAAIRRHINSPEIAEASEIVWAERKLHIQIHHYPDPWLTGPDALPEEFAADYRARFDPSNALGQSAAACLIASFLSGRPQIIGAVPSFDTERIRHQLLRPARIPDPWHYHLIDVENIVAGYLRGRDLLPAMPWKSDQLSLAAGVDPAEFDRHTAMGDVLWTRAQWDAVIGADIHG